MTQQTVPVTKVVVGENPRTYFDPEDQKQLERSIEVFGLLAPITVLQEYDGTFRLVAGERRLRAFQALGIDEIPAHVTDVANTEAAKVAENVVRVNLHPIEEGRAYLALLQAASTGKKIKPATLSKQIGIPAARITERIRYALLPGHIADSMISGHPIDRWRSELTDFVENFGADIVEAWVESDLEHFASAEQTEDLHELFMRWSDLRGDTGIHEAAWQAWRQLPGPVSELLLEDAKEKGIPDYDLERVFQIHDQESLDAARAFGCLVTFKNADQYGSDIDYLTSEEWLVDRIRYKISQYEVADTDAPAKPKKQIDPETGEVREPTAEELDAAEREAKAEKRAVAAAAKALREEKGRANQAFGVNLTRKLEKRKPTADDARVLAEMVLDSENAIGLCWEVVKPDEKVDGSDRFQKQRAMLTWVQKGRSADVIIGRLFQVILATLFHDDGALVKSRQPGRAFHYLNDYSGKAGKSYDHLLSILATVGPDEISTPWVEARAKQISSAADREAAADAREAERAERLATKAAAANTDGETTLAAGEINEADEAPGLADVLDGLEDSSIIEDDEGNLVYADEAPDPTTEPTVSPEEADEPLLSEQAAAASTLVDGDQEAQIQKLAQQSKDALQAELDRATEEIS
jgi:ParB/RepB/Spo0J family partition protein